MSVKVNKLFDFKIEEKDNKIMIDGEEVSYSLSKLDSLNYHLLLNGHSHKIELLAQDSSSRDAVLLVDGKSFKTQTEAPLAELLKKLGISSTKKKSNELKAPMPGLVLDIIAKEGDSLEKGDSLLILEAMKMENVIKAEHAVTIKNIEINVGDKVDKNQILMVFETSK